jgi:hypothetical protein
MPEDKEGTGFKVSDRRLFNPDGTLREEAPERQESPPAITPEPVLGSSRAQAQRALEPEPVVESAESQEGEPEATEFMDFLMGVASSAFIHLGLMEHPATGRRQVDLLAAQHSIDMLVMLRHKTQGNLTPEEEHFFDGLLTDLRMQFVSLRR